MRLVTTVTAVTRIFASVLITGELPGQCSLDADEHVHTPSRREARRSGPPFRVFGGSVVVVQAGRGSVV
jgi:hypothetical protein